MYFLFSIGYFVFLGDLRTIRVELQSLFDAEIVLQSPLVTFLVDCHFERFFGFFFSSPCIWCIISQSCCVDCPRYFFFFFGVVCCVGGDRLLRTRAAILFGASSGHLQNGLKAYLSFFTLYPVWVEFSTLELFLLRVYRTT
uniref:Uncharacterized protein n=1 Tax=Ixodes ricinus TaxID=34613 RepID=A0A0K8R3J9_IXORI